MPGEDKMKTLIAIPCMDMVNALFMKSLLTMQLEGTVEFSLAIGSLIYDARNQLGYKAVSGGFDRVLWLDSDMTFEPDMFKRLSARVDEGAEFVSGMYFTRKAPIQPVIYKTVGMEGNTPKAISFTDYPRDSIFEVAGAGFGAVMMTADLIRRVADKFGLPFSPVVGFGEDLSFCLRVTELGIPMFCDSSIKLGHIGHIEIDEKTYLKGGI